MTGTYRARLPGDDGSGRDPSPVPALAVHALVASVLVFVYSNTVADPDLWGHVRFGLDFWRDGLARTDGYSYLTGSGSWVNHEWAAEALMALVWDRGGAFGLVVLKLALVLGTALVAIRHLRARGLSDVAAATWFLYGWLLVLPWLTSVRPQAFTYFAFACLLALLDRAERESRALWWGLPLFAVWANVHGGVLAGIGLTLVWLTALGVARLPGAHGARSRALAVACLLAVTLVNPYGTGLWTFLRTALTMRAEIAEWNPVDTGGLEGVAFLLVLVPAAAGWLFTRRPASAARAALFCVCAVAPLVARRHTPLFAIAAIMYAGEHVADTVEALVARVTTARRSRAAPPAHGPLTGLVWTMAAVLALASVPHWRQVWYDASSFPVEAVGRLARCGVRGDMVTFFDWGEYAIWHLAPGVRVSMDGRRETVYADDVYADNMRFVDGAGEWDAILHRGAPALALVNKRFASFNLMVREPGWTLVQQDAGAALFARTSSFAHSLPCLARPARPAVAAERLVFP